MRRYVVFQSPNTSYDKPQPIKSLDHSNETILLKPSQMDTLQCGFNLCIPVGLFLMVSDANTTEFLNIFYLTIYVNISVCICYSVTIFLPLSTESSSLYDQYCFNPSCSWSFLLSQRFVVQSLTEYPLLQWNVWS